MLTIFSIPKAFRGHTGVIQHNAIRSWTLLRPACEIILLGDDEGTKAAAQEYGVRHLPEIARNEYGTPLVNAIFEAGERAARNDVLCYVNSDIVLMPDFMDAVSCLATRLRWFLMVGQRTNLQMDGRLDFGVGWEQRLRSACAQRGRLYRATGVDYFVFSRGLWGQLPPFAVGRTTWDNWLLYRARIRGATMIDATKAILAVHQEHDYDHHPLGSEGVWKGAEAKQNLELAGSLSHIFTIKDTMRVLTPTGLGWEVDRWRLWRLFRTWPVLDPFLPGPVRRLLLAVLERKHRKVAALRGG